MNKVLARLCFCLSFVVIYGCWGSVSYKNERVDGPWEIADEYIAIDLPKTFKNPNDAFSFTLHLGVDPEQYDDNLGYHYRFVDGFDPNKPLDLAGELVRLSDGMVIIPEVELIDSEGNAHELHSVVSMRWFTGEFSVGYDGLGDVLGRTFYEPYIDTAAPYFTQLRIRSKTPFELKFVTWRAGYQ